MSESEAVYETWSIEQLKRHPLQPETYRQRTPEEMQELEDLVVANDMHPIHIAPDGTILDGHQRLIVARDRLGWSEVPVYVRHDLAAKGPWALEDYFLHANPSSRHFSQRDLARLIRTEMEVEARRRKEDPEYRPAGRIRDLVARRHGVNARTMASWIALLDAPNDVQSEVEAKRISLAEGLRVARASEDEQAAILNLMWDQLGTRRAIKQVLGDDDRPPLTPAKLTRRWRDLIRAAIDVNGALPGSLGSILREHRKGLLTLVQLANAVEAYLKTTPVQDMRKKLRANAQTDDAGPDDGTDSAEQPSPIEPGLEMPTAPLAPVPRPTLRSGSMPVKSTPVPLVGPRGAPRPVPQPKPRPRDANAAPDSRPVGRPHPIPQIPKPKPA